LRILFAVVSILTTAGCGGLQVDIKQQSAPAVQTVQLETTQGPIVIQLFSDRAPRNAETFLKLCEGGAFDRTYFHRVAPGYLVQGGDPNTRDDDRANDGFGGTKIEGTEEGLPLEATELKHLRGTVSSVGSGGAGQSTSQFFILLKDDPTLDGKYTVLGKVTAGIELVEEISEQPGDEYPDHGGVNPSTAQVILRCTVQDATQPQP